MVSGRYAGPGCRRASRPFLSTMAGMSDRQSFIRAICDAPDDDAPRLIYADWLDENGEDKLAGFIRLQCELYNLPPAKVCNGCDPWGFSCRCCKLRKQINEILSGDWRVIVPTFPLLIGRASPPRFEGHAHVKFARGFVYHVELSSGDWLAHADAITAEHPIREVFITRPLAVPATFIWNNTRYLSFNQMAEVRWPRIKFSLPLDERRTALTPVWREPQDALDIHPSQR